MTLAEVPIFKEGGWDALAKSEAWGPSAGVWPRFIPYIISNIGMLHHYDGYPFY